MLLEEGDSVDSTHKLKRRWNANLLWAVMEFKNEKAMNTHLFLKHWESLLEKKYENDVADIAMGIQPRPISNFMLDYFKTSFGLKNLAYKNLSSFLKQLLEFYQSN